MSKNRKFLKIHKQIVKKLKKCEKKDHQNGVKFVYFQIKRKKLVKTWNI